MELEQTLGASCWTGRREVTPTEAGLAYFERCNAIIARVEETEAQVSRLHDEPRGVLRVNAPMSFGTLYLGDAIADFMALYTALKVELTLTDRFIDPLEEGVDVTVRIGRVAGLEPHCAAHRPVAHHPRGFTGLPQGAWDAGGARRSRAIIAA